MGNSEKTCPLREIFDTASSQRSLQLQHIWEKKKPNWKIKIFFKNSNYKWLDAWNLEYIFRRNDVLNCQLHSCICQEGWIKSNGTDGIASGVQLYTRSGVNRPDPVVLSEGVGWVTFKVSACSNNLTQSQNTQFR